MSSPKRQVLILVLFIMKRQFHIPAEKSRRYYGYLQICCKFVLYIRRSQGWV